MMSDLLNLNRVAFANFVTHRAASTCSMLDNNHLVQYPFHVTLPSDPIRHPATDQPPSKRARISYNDNNNLNTIPPSQKSPISLYLSTSSSSSSLSHYHSPSLSPSHSPSHSLSSNSTSSTSTHIRTPATSPPLSPVTSTKVRAKRKYFSSSSYTSFSPKIASNQVTALKADPGPAPALGAVMNKCSVLNMLNDGHNVNTNSSSSARTNAQTIGFMQLQQLHQQLQTHAHARQWHECKTCQRLFASGAELKTHKAAVHSRPRPYACHVPGCSASFSKANHLSRHVRIVHNKERPFACNEPGCGARFGSKSHLGDHTKAVHMRLRTFKCPMCNASWSKRFNLQKHIRIRHLREKPYKCSHPSCDMSFGTLSHVTRHEVTVHKRAPQQPQAAVVLQQQHHNHQFAVNVN